MMCFDLEFEFCTCYWSTNLQSSVHMYIIAPRVIKKEILYPITCTCIPLATVCVST